MDKQKMDGWMDREWIYGWKIDATLLEEFVWNWTLLRTIQRLFKAELKSGNTLNSHKISIYL